jgi:hypothetical protein
MHPAAVSLGGGQRRLAVADQQERPRTAVAIWLGDPRHDAGCLIREADAVEFAEEYAQAMRKAGLAWVRGTVAELLDGSLDWQSHDCRGRTTTLRILTTLLPADAGEAFVAGADVTPSPQRVHRRIGYVGQLAVPADPRPASRTCCSRAGSAA